MTGWEQVLTMLGSPLMQRAIIAAVLVGAAAPVVGTFLVQRRMALMGDGVGHVALTGVALGWLVGSWAAISPADTLAVPGAVIAAIVGSVVIELVRERGRTSGDLALAIMFYGGIAGGVLLMNLAGGTNASLMGYLFGSISTVSTQDLWWTAALAVLVLCVGVGLRGALFAVSHDEEFARASGLPVRLLSMVVATLAALTVTIAMRVVGVLLVSALMIVPVAIAQLYARSFGRTMAVASGIGTTVSVVGLVVTYWRDIPPGATIVVLAIVVYAAAAVLQPLLTRRHADSDPHPDMSDDVVVPASDPDCATPAGSAAGEPGTSVR
ncbi:metal ABC transporter permease [Cellulomonas phragmiteti]|uniref:ABC transporter n=1 Tax=Cellulomonas phragmiteti TaxID=478780 RepID=A0ABQ4DKP8_9CELL|nr:metal ABC transporter permease [Cellulomonas phragmiteti]GIG39930.1 ABC transporter [Cellulomonas phragmiteti]